MALPFDPIAILGYGHFGRAPDADGGFSWEKTDLVDQLKGLA